MRLENRFHAIARDPVQRIIRVHAHSLDRLRRNRLCREIAPAAREADAGQCRIIINAQRREIDRLMRSIDRFDWSGPRQTPVPLSAGRPVDGESGAEFAQLASANGGRRLYAVAPVGRPVMAVAFGALSSNSTKSAVHVPGGGPTHMGSVLDVLA